MLTPKGTLWVTASLVLTLLGLASHSFGLTLAGVMLGFHVLAAVTLLEVRPPTGRLEVERDQITEGDHLGVRFELDHVANSPTVLSYRLCLPPTFRVVSGAAGGNTVLGADEHRRIDLEIRPELHGPYGIGPLEVRLRDPANLVFRARELAEEVPLLSLPRIERLRDVPLKSRLATPYLGLHEAQQPGHGFEFYALRQYHPGDPIRNINWRASARSEETIVNQRVKESFAYVTVLVDGRAWEGLGIEEHAPWYRSARAAASLVDDFMGSRDQVTIRIVSREVHTIKPQPPDRQRRTLLETLASVQPEGSSSIAQQIENLLPSLRPRSLFILISSLEAEPGISEAVKQLGVREIPVLVIAPSTQWPEDHGEGQALLRQAKRCRARELSACRAMGALVVDWKPGMLLSVELQEVLVP